ncbi:MAG: heavy metal-binding domain-containing protein [Acidimicrobiales bacterium]
MSVGGSLHDQFLAAMQDHGRRGPAPGRAGGRPVTSDLTIDEVLLLHSISWEPVDLVCGASVGSIPMGIWQWGVGEITQASAAHTQAVATAVQRIEAECRQVGGVGVVGVKIVFDVHPHHVDAILTGTAVRPSAGGTERHPGFVSDLSTRDFVLLHQAGWQPLGLAFGASFVHAPRRGALTAMQQKSVNVELTNFTEALYAARESAMERMQAAALYLRGKGVVAVQVNEGPMHFARHAIGFTAWGTTVAPGAGGHQYLRPDVVLPLDDAVVGFDAASLHN